MKRSTAPMWSTSCASSWSASRRGCSRRSANTPTCLDLTKERLKRLNKNYTIMHPGPMNRGVEITTEVADSDRSVILEQVTNGQAVRMAVLYLLSGRKEGEAGEE